MVHWDPQCVVRGQSPCLLLLAGVWLTRLQRAKSQSHTAGLVSNNNKVIQPHRHLSLLVDTMEIHHPQPLSIVEAMGRLPLPALHP